MGSMQQIEIFFLCFFVLLLLILFLAKFLHSRPRLLSVLSEPAMTVVFGIACSFIIRCFQAIDEDIEGEDSNRAYLAATILNFPTRVFFMALLPPILFDSGYQLQRELFYRHFGPIALFACFGTCVSGITVGYFLWMTKDWMGDFDPTLLELLTFGAMLAATDTVSVVSIMKNKKVDPHLYSLVFGESALNDAVAIVLFHTMADFLVNHGENMDHDSIVEYIWEYAWRFGVEALCSPVLGIAFAFFMALALRFADLKEHLLIELSVFLLPIYISYILAEVLGMSGMISVFFTGMFAKRYMEPNVSATTSQHAVVLFRLMAFLAETCIFLELGLSVASLLGSFEWKFIGLSLVAALLGRAFSIYPLALLHNLSLTRLKTQQLQQQQQQQQQLDEQQHQRPLPPSPERRRQDLEQISPIEAIKFFYRSSRSSTMDDHDEGVEDTSTAHSEAASATSTSLGSLETPLSKRDKWIPVNFMHMLWFSGLRGAVAYACARKFPDLYGHNDEFVAATMVIVVFTIVIMGGGTETVLDCLKISVNVDEAEYMRHWHSRRRLKGFLHRFEYNFLYKCAVDQEDAQELPREPIQEMATWGISNTPINKTSFGREVLSNQWNSHFFRRKRKNNHQEGHEEEGEQGSNYNNNNDNSGQHLEKEVVVDHSSSKALPEDDLSFDYTSIRDDSCCNPIV